MEDQMCSSEKYLMKNSCNKNILLEWKKSMIKIFLIEYKFISIE